MRPFKLVFCLLLPLVLPLAGCVEAGAKAIEDASHLHQAGRAYVMEVHDARREVRRLCWEMLMAEVKDLEHQDRWADARARLKANYPGLVAPDLAKQARDDPLGIMSQPFGCE